MLFNIAAGLLIFGYSGWALVKYYKKSKQGKCAACELNNHCNSKCK
ncbi:FeoB-associated Cys-rich membrane protein [Paenibacillus sp. SYP-B3998]|uniref:FeoB-associated Cys-rich membrane protein n=1 Tax=Paenibacillus sp. SYP-B3998 TaxID=2678564 RepID=A0A6G3ZUZ2_9BACL|nr:FeoB-associated Cys-rich membrane protein [Paenibacillus sp. SYP-B3998]NEW05890.1 FeoB-associated Cys-rich membrane protein [Paenibacillus sp. SYP-B3998]